MKMMLYFRPDQVVGCKVTSIIFGSGGFIGNRSSGAYCYQEWTSLACLVVGLAQIVSELPYTGSGSADTCFDSCLHKQSSFGRAVGHNSCFGPASAAAAFASDAAVAAVDHSQTCVIAPAAKVAAEEEATSGSMGSRGKTESACVEPRQP